MNTSLLRNSIYVAKFKTTLTWAIDKVNKYKVLANQFSWDLFSYKTAF